MMTIVLMHSCSMSLHFHFNDATASETDTVMNTVTNFVAINRVHATASQLIDRINKQHKNMTTSVMPFSDNDSVGIKCMMPDCEDVIVTVKKNARNHVIVNVDGNYIARSEVASHVAYLFYTNQLMNESRAALEDVARLINEDTSCEAKVIGVGIRHYPQLIVTRDNGDGYDFSSTTITVARKTLDGHEFKVGAEYSDSKTACAAWQARDYAAEECQQQWLDQLKR